MKYSLTIALGMIVSLTSATGPADVVDLILERVGETPSPTEVEVVEIFRAMDVEELEAALTDGYPMPWLEEILSDETIPEEDRYWLDCRVRAVIAQDLHLFFNREGNPIHIEADWIAPGEDYWREHMMVNPVGEDYSWDAVPEGRPSFIGGEPGYILNLYGEKVGDLAVANMEIRLSRDARVGTMVGCEYWQYDVSAESSYLCMLYPEGSYIEKSLEVIGSYYCEISDDGSTIVLNCHHPTSSDGQGTVYTSDNFGNLTQIVDIKGYLLIQYRPAISLDGNHCAVPLRANGIALVNITDGVSNIINEVQYASSIFFTPDGKHLCVGGESGVLVDVNTAGIIWSIPRKASDGISYMYFKASNDTRCIVVLEVKYGESIGERLIDEQRIYWNRELIHIDSEFTGNMDISPNGFIVFQTEKPTELFITADRITPCVIRMIKGVE